MKSEPIRIRMKELPKPIEVIADDGRMKSYTLAPSGKLGACLNKAPGQSGACKRLR